MSRNTSLFTRISPDFRTDFQVWNLFGHADKREPGKTQATSKWKIEPSAELTHFCIVRKDRPSSKNSILTTKLNPTLDSHVRQALYEIHCLFAKTIYLPGYVTQSYFNSSIGSSSFISPPPPSLRIPERSWPGFLANLKLEVHPRTDIPRPDETQEQLPLEHETNFLTKYLI